MESSQNLNIRYNLRSRAVIDSSQERSQRYSLRSRVVKNKRIRRNTSSSSSSSVVSSRIPRTSSPIPVVQATNALLNSRNDAASSDNNRYERKDRQLKVMLQQNYGDAVNYVNPKISDRLLRKNNNNNNEDSGENTTRTQSIRVHDDRSLRPVVRLERSTVIDELVRARATSSTTVNEDIHHQDDDDDDDEGDDRNLGRAIISDTRIPVVRLERSSVIDRMIRSRSISSNDNGGDSVDRGSVTNLSDFRVPVVELDRSLFIEELIASRRSDSIIVHRTDDDDDDNTNNNSEDNRVREETNTTNTLSRVEVRLERSSLIDQLIRSGELATIIVDRVDEGNENVNSNSTYALVTVGDDNDNNDANTSLVITSTTTTTTSNDDDDEDIRRRDSVPARSGRTGHRRHALIPHRVTYRNGIAVGSERIERLCNNPHKCGTLNDLCSFCGALFYTHENITRSQEHTSCCNRGAYTVPPLSPCPLEIKNLYTSSHSSAIQFRRNIRYLNSLFAMASFKTSQPIPRRRDQGHWSFSVCGQIYHFFDPLPNAGDFATPTLYQMYFLDDEEAIRRRNAFAEERGVDSALVGRIERCLRMYNRFARAYKTMGEELRERRRRNMEVDNIVIGIVKEPNINILARRQDSNWVSSRSDIAAIFEGSEPPIDVDLVLYPHRADDPDSRNRHHEIKLLNPMADPMVYPLLFPCGDYGFHSGIAYNERSNGATRRTVTLHQYYRYRLYFRDTFSTIHHGGKLFQQYIVDGWVKCEMSRLWWYRQHQMDFRRTTEAALRRYNANRPDHVGRAIILPATYFGSERYRIRQYSESLAITARFGNPDLFVTFTCNPHWPEIKNNVLPNQKWENRPDLICRVFQMKLLAFIDDIVHKQIYGVVINHQYVIEFQRRGLPHAHIVITLHNDDKLIDGDAVDNIISARIPDERTQPLLYGCVRDYQLHAPCGELNVDASCMIDGRCSQCYPKPYREETALAVGTYIKRAEYKRPNDGRRIYVEAWQRSVTNRRVVPYNAYALATYQCHVSFDAVGSSNTVRYLYKYMFKRPRSVRLYVDKESNGIDEIQDYIDRRYVNAMEATWRLFEFVLHKRSHSVIYLPVHLPGQRELLYNEWDDIDEVDRRLSPNRRSKLEAWFALNRNDVDARQYKYVEIPERYVWNDVRCEWRKRSQISKQFGILLGVSPSEGGTERFFLRLLLKHIAGATCFDDLLTLDNGDVCDTFRMSCHRRDLLLASDGGYNDCLQEAGALYPAWKIRNLFALICCVSIDDDFVQIKDLWRRYCTLMIADLRRNSTNQLNAIGECMIRLENMIGRCRPVLSLIDLGIAIDDDYDDDEDDHDNGHVGVENINDGDGNDHEAEEEEDVDDDDNYSSRNVRNGNYTIASLNNDQKKIFLRVLKACSRKLQFSIPSYIYEDLVTTTSGADDDRRELDGNCREHLFYMDGPGGTGKTHLYNTLLTVLRDTFEKDVIAVAWTGIAANILIGGTTVHRAFRLPMTLTEQSVCGWDIESPRSRYIKNAALVIWDEAPMTPRFAVEAVDRYLKDIMRRYEPMGGKCCLFGGDFRQILPVVIGGKEFDITNQTLKSSRLWSAFVKMQLTENMRVLSDDRPDGGVVASRHSDLNNLRFDEWLLRLGDGTLPFVQLDRRSAPMAPDNLIEIPKRFYVSTIEQLIDFVYEGDYTSRRNSSRAILCPTNAAVASINDDIIRRINTDRSKLYLSEDSYAAAENDEFNVTVDLLNAIDTPSLPPHELLLKRGVIVMLLRNLDVDRGACNGSRMRVLKLGNHTIECELLSGQRIGRTLILPRIKMKAETSLLPREMVRFQFPIRLAYGMTVNKAQGQTMNRVGICLKTPCFSHGQLYVAFSRVGNVDGVRIFIEDGGKQGTFKFRGRKIFTSNVVYRSIIDNERNADNDRPVVVPRRITINDDDDDNIVVVDNTVLADAQGDAITNDNDQVIVVVEEEEDSDPDYVSDRDFSTPPPPPPRLPSPRLLSPNYRPRISIYDRPGTSGLNVPITGGGTSEGRPGYEVTDYTDDSD